MRFLNRLTTRKPEDDRPIAHRINFEGPAPYMKSFTGSGFGVVFEDGGEVGYFYATNESIDEVLDALHLYNTGSKEQVKPGDKVLIVWNPNQQKAGIFYYGRLQAVVDFKNRQACCRTESPPADGRWCRSSHDWNDVLLEGLA